jgi:hypothetical protein
MVKYSDGRRFDGMVIEWGTSNEYTKFGPLFSSRVRLSSAGWALRVLNILGVGAGVTCRSCL